MVRKSSEAGGLSPQDRAVGAYLGLAVGDALGATVEFMTPLEIKARYGSHREIRGGGWLRLVAGQVTDDTTMSLHLGNAMRAVLQALFCCDGFEAAMVDVVNRGGDADTTGAILGMIAGAYYGPDAIPQRWLHKLDGRIRVACEAQARALIAPGR